MNYPINLCSPIAPSNAAIGDRTHQSLTASYGVVHHVALAPGLVLDDGGGYELPEADAYARRLADEAEAWLDHARARSRMKRETLTQKALSALSFTMRHRAHDFAVPSKLGGTSKHQPALWSMVNRRVRLGDPLDVEEVAGMDPAQKRPQLVVSFEGERLGEVQSKHVPWLRPLVPFGARLFVVRVTGQESDFTLGCNVAFGRVGSAVAALNRALGTDIGGDGHGASQAPTEAVPARVRPVPEHGGDGAAAGVRLVSTAQSVATPRADTKDGDIVLYREIDGTARAAVEHAVRHSPSGIEWGYHGSGPADLARSVLLRFTDVTTADRLYQRFKADVIAFVPRAGGVIYANDVRAWLAANDA